MSHKPTARQDLIGEPPFPIELHGNMGLHCQYRENGGIQTGSNPTGREKGKEKRSIEDFPKTMIAPLEGR